MVAAAHYEARDLSVLVRNVRLFSGFCRDWRSVAEISAVLRMPLGVARILIADMAVEGLVRIHQLDHAQGARTLTCLKGCSVDFASSKAVSDVRLPTRR